MTLSARDDYTSTAGRRFLDMIVQALVGGVANGSHGFHPPEVWAKSLNKYIRTMSGDVSAMIETLQDTYRWSAAKPTDIRRLKKFAHARQTLRVYIDEIEIRTGNHVEQDLSKAGRKRGRGRGYSVNQVKSGKFRVVLTFRDHGRGKQIALVDTRAQGHTLGRFTVAALRVALA